MGKRIGKKSDNDEWNFLTEEELVMFANFDFSQSIRLNIVKDYFLLCCFTGMTVKEIKNLKDIQFFIPLEGESYVMLKDGDDFVNITLPKKAFDIFDHYDFQMPQINSVAIDKGIREIGNYISEIESISEETKIKFKKLSMEFAFNTAISLIFEYGDDYVDCINFQ